MHTRKALSTLPLLLTLLLLGLATSGWAQVPASLTVADMEGDLAGCRGLARDTEVVREGRGSGRWDNHPKNRTADLGPIPADWSQFDSLEVWLHSAAANGARFVLIMRSENPETDGMDYWMQAFTVDWTGWRHVRIGLKSLGHGARKPRGWDQIDTVYFTAHGWSCEPKPDTVIHIDGVRLTNDPIRVSLDQIEAAATDTGCRYRCSIGVADRVDTGHRINVAASAPEGATVTCEPQVLALAPGKTAHAEVTVRVGKALLRQAGALARGQVQVQFTPAGESAGRPVGLSIPLSRICLWSLPAKAHPRVLVTPRLVEELRRRAKTDPKVGHAARAILRGADGLIKRYEKGIPEQEAASVEKGKVLPPRAETLAMAYLLTEDRKYAQAAAKLIAALRGWSTWVYEFHNGLIADLGTGGALRHAGTAYDWAYNGMTEPERRSCREAIGVGLGLWQKAVDGRIWWSRSTYNWCPVCCAGGGLAGMALLDEWPGARNVVADAFPPIVRFLDAAPQDGGCGEGAGYWGYGVSHAALFADALKVLTDGQLNLFEHPYLQATWQFPLYMHCPPNGAINFADCGYGRPSAVLTLQLAKELVNPYAAWYYRQRPRVTPLSLLWETQAPEGKMPEDLPQSKHFEDLDWAALRSGWDGDETVFGIRGGHNGHNHGMLECGSFVLNAFGQRLIMDYGAMKYTHEYFSRKRWSFYRANSHGSNVVLVDDQDQRAGRKAEGRIHDFFTSPQVDYLRLDATKTYPEFVKRIERHVLFLKPDRIALFDDVLCEGERSFEWRCHPATGGAVALGQGRMAVENGEGALAVRWLLPERVSVAGGKEEGEDYHVSVRPNGKASAMRFLTVMQCHRRGDAQILFEMAEPDRRRALAAGPRVLLIMPAESEQWRHVHRLMRSQGIDVDWVGERRADSLPSDAKALAGYAAVLLVPFDRGAAAFAPGQLQAIADYVKAGGGLIMGGGGASFGAGGFDQSPLAELLPVSVIRKDDNVAHVRQRPSPVAADHPLLAGLPAKWPVFGSGYGGYYDLRLKPGAAEVLRVDPKVAKEAVPFVAASEAGRGRCLTFPAIWGFSTGRDFVQWPHAAHFFANAVAWLSHGRAQPQPGRDMAAGLLAADRFPLDKTRTTNLPVDNGMGYRFETERGLGLVLVRTGEGQARSYGYSTDARAMVVMTGPDDGPELLAAVDATTIGRDGETWFRSSRPMSFSWLDLRGAGRATVQCAEDTEVMVPAIVGSRLRVGGQPVPVRQADDPLYVMARIPAGRHRVHIEP